MGRSPCCAKEGLNRGAWTAMEDRILTEYIATHGEGKWRNLPKRAGLSRCGKSCRLRWLNYLRPDIKRGNITRDEEDLILRLHKLLGNRWSLIAGRLPGRTDNEIKNYWNTNIGKKAQDQKSPSNSDVANITHHQKPLTDETKEKNTKVVRTKASRCTQVFIPNKSQIEEVTTTTTGDLTCQQRAPSPSVNQDSDQVKNDDPALMMMKMGTGTDDDHLPITDDDVSPFLNLDVENYDNSNSCEFMLDFKFDESFISEFLNVDLSQICNSNGANGGDSTHVAATSYNSCGEDGYQKLHGPDFQPSMATIVDSEFDWLM